VAREIRNDEMMVAFHSGNEIARATPPCRRCRPRLY